LNKLILYILFPSLIVFHSSCSQKKDIKSSKINGDQNLNIILSDPVETLDPLKILYVSDWRVACNIYEGLINLDKKNEIRYQLVDSLSIDDEKKIYSFLLKENVFFHDNPCFQDGRGRKLNSFDIKFLLERLADPRNKFSNYKILENSILGFEEFRNGKTDSITGLKIIDSLSFKIELIEPNSSFLLYLTSPNFFLIPEEALIHYGERVGENPVGTGPFRISEYQKYKRILLVKNENYYKYDQDGIQLPYLNSIEFRTIKKTENRFTELIKNNSHFINANHDECKTLKSNLSITEKFNVIGLDKGSGVRYWGFYFDNNKSSQRYKALRKRIALNFDRGFIENSDNSFKIANTLVPEFHLKDFDRQWLADVKLNQDEDLGDFILDTITVMSNLIYPDLLEIEKTLKKLKIPFKRIIKKADYYSSIPKLKPTIFRVSMMPTYPDPMEYYSLFYSSNPPEINLGNFSSHEYDAVYENLLSEDNKTKKNEAYLRLERILEEEIAAIYLSHSRESHFIYSKNLINVSFKYTLPDFTNSYFAYNEE